MCVYVFFCPGMVSCMDEGVQNITKTLERFDMWKNTVFIFSTGTIVLSGLTSSPWILLCYLV